MTCLRQGNGLKRKPASRTVSEPEGTSAKTTPLRARHEALGARFTPFSGYEMPLQFQGILAEHEAVRQHAGIFDVSHMSNLEVPRDQADALSHALAADVTTLDDGAAKYTVCLREDGTILDDLIVFVLPQAFHVVPNAGMNAAVAEAFGQTGCTVRDLTEERCILAVQGPAARGLIEDRLALDNLPGRMQAAHLPDGGFVAGTGYTGEDGVEFFVEPESAGRILDTLVEAGVTPCGLGARDTLRLEKGFCLAGNEFDPQVTPVEARLLWTVDLGHAFVGRKAVLERKDQGPEKVLAGIRLTDRGVPRRGCRVLASGQAAGTVSSGTMSPTLGDGIALAYLAPDHTDPGTTVTVEVRGRQLAGKVAEVPFL